MFFTYYAKTIQEWIPRVISPILSSHELLILPQMTLLKISTYPYFLDLKNTDVVSAISPRIGFDLLLVESQI